LKTVFYINCCVFNRMEKNFDFSSIKHELNVARVKRRLFNDNSGVEAKRRKMVRPIKKKLEIPTAIQDYQKKNSHLKRIVFDKYYKTCVEHDKYLLDKETTFLFDKRTKAIVGKLQHPNNEIVNLCENEWKTVFERLIVAQFQYKNPFLKKKVFETLFEKKVEIIKRHETLGFYIHDATKFVFDYKTKNLVGKLVDDKIVALSDSDWELCVSTFRNVFSRPVQ